MKHKSNMALVALLLVSIACGNVYANQHDDFVKGALAIGAVAVGVGAAVAFADWCFSETDDQMMARIDRECRAAATEYGSTIRQFEAALKLNYAAASYVTVPETALFDFATMVWMNGSHLSSYRSSLNATHSQLSTAVNTLRKRIHALENKYNNYDDQRRLMNMRNLLTTVLEVNTGVSLFAECLEHHKTYFNLYDTVGAVRNTHARQFSIVESASYTDIIAYDLKNSIISSSNSRYPFRRFINTVESDIARLKSDIRALKYNYEAGRRYANLTLDQLVWMKNVVMTDGRYAQELYEYEQERLQRLQIEALEAQARAERDRINVLREQNRILERRNRIEQEKMWRKSDNKFNKNNDAIVLLEVNLC